MTTTIIGPNIASCSGISTKKTDMHNFGVVFLYLLTKKPGHFTGLRVANNIKREIEQGTSVVHESLMIGGCTDENATKMFKIILDCVQENKNARPSISDVIHMLNDMGL